MENEKIQMSLKGNMELGALLELLNEFFPGPHLFAPLT
jgi:hypothetical protein